MGLVWCNSKYIGLVFLVLWLGYSKKQESDEAMKKGRNAQMKHTQ